MSLFEPSCRHYRGDLPCSIGKVCRSCEEPMPYEMRHLIIKLGAMGDALRTTPLLRALKAESDCEITWITDRASAEVLSLVPLIDRLLVMDSSSILRIEEEEFDRIYSLDKDPAAAALAVRARAKEKKGFALAKTGVIVPFDEDAAYILSLGIDDDLKFSRNTKTVPELTLEVSGFEWDGEEYSFEIPRKSLSEGRALAEKAGPRPVGLNLGVGPRWPSKAWPLSSWEALSALVRSEGMTSVLLGGPDEKTVVEELASRGVGINPGIPLPVAEFAGLVAALDCVVTSDTLALHIAIAAGTPVVGLFCSTTSREIEFYGRGLAVSSDEGPCYDPNCPSWPGCMEKIRPEAVLSAIRSFA